MSPEISERIIKVLCESDESMIVGKLAEVLGEERSGVGVVLSWMNRREAQLVRMKRGSLFEYEWVTCEKTR